MNKTAIAFSTCDRTELTKKSITPLFEPNFDLWWIDGSKTKEGRTLQGKFLGNAHRWRANVGGGSAAAVVYGLSTILDAPEKYSHIGLVENDVVLPPDWYHPTMELFERGKADGLEVGAVTARTYKDRVLIQRDGYAVLHNAGFGMQIYTREAAELVLQTLRSHVTLENRKVFAILIGQDIGRYWAFRGQDCSLMADWGVDRILAQHGLSSLGLTPSRVEMIGQIPPLEQQGLAIADEPQELLRNDGAFAQYRDKLKAIRTGELNLHACGAWYQDPVSAQWHIYPHQVERLGGRYIGPWRLQSNLGFGTFSWVAGDEGHDGMGYIYDLPTLELPVLGPIDFLVSGGAIGGQIEIVDESSGFTCAPKLPPQGDNMTVMQISVPASVLYRTIRLTAKTPGPIFYGAICRERQPFLPHVRFTYESLAKP